MDYSMRKRMKFNIFLGSRFFKFKGVSSGIGASVIFKEMIEVNFVYLMHYPIYLDDVIALPTEF